MSGVLAALRPSDWELPLFVHVLGAILLMGALLVTGWSLLAGWRRRDPALAVPLTRFGLWSLLLGVVPAYLVMRIGAEWIYSREDFAEDPDWIGFGYLTADIGALLILFSLALGIVGLRRLRPDAERSTLGRIVAVVALLLILAYAFAVWAMTSKPG